MKTIFDRPTIAALTTRIQTLRATDQAEWGKMTVYQMLKHCTLCEEMFQGKKRYKRLFIGRLFGRMVLQRLLKEDNSLKRNQPTHPTLRITGTGNYVAEQQKWITLLEDYTRFNNPDFVHPFFGRMTMDEIGQYVYKHTDHHLRQFGR